MSFHMPTGLSGKGDVLFAKAGTQKHTDSAAKVVELGKRKGGCLVPAEPMKRCHVDIKRLGDVPIELFIKNILPSLTGRDISQLEQVDRFFRSLIKTQMVSVLATLSDSDDEMKSIIKDLNPVQKKQLVQFAQSCGNLPVCISMVKTALKAGLSISEITGRSLKAVKAILADFNSYKVPDTIRQQFLRSNCQLLDLNGRDLRFGQFLKLVQVLASSRHLQGVVEIDLQNNKLGSVPSILFKTCLQVKNLYLSGNGLAKLPTEIKSLKKLEVLYLQDNNFSEFPSEILDFDKLNYLDVSQNNISELPKEAICYAKLNSLNVGANKLSILPEFIYGLSSLYYLNVSHNSNLTVSEAVLSISDLRHVDLMGLDATKHAEIIAVFRSRPDTLVDV